MLPRAREGGRLAPGRVSIGNQTNVKHLVERRVMDKKIRKSGGAKGLFLSQTK